MQAEQEPVALIESIKYPTLHAVQLVDPEEEHDKQV
jgi:hypothetical protein